VLQQQLSQQECRVTGQLAGGVTQLVHKAGQQRLKQKT
jgi:hypothetical protein